MTQENFNFIVSNMYQAIRNENENVLIRSVMAAWSVACDENLEI